MFSGASLNDAIFLALAWPVESGRRHLIVLLTDGVASWRTTDGDALLALINRSEADMHFLMSAPKPNPAEANTRYGGSIVLRPGSPDAPGGIVMGVPSDEGEGLATDG